MPIDWYWWLTVAALVYLAVAAMLAFRRSKRWTMALFFIAASLAMVAGLLLLFARAPARRVPDSAESLEKLQRSTAMWASSSSITRFLAYPLAGLAGLGEILRLRKLPPKAPQTQERTYTSSPPQISRDELTTSLVIAVSCLVPFAIIARVISEQNHFRWLLYMNPDLVGLVSCIAGLGASILLIVRDGRWLALGLGGLIVSLALLFPHPPGFL